MDLIFIDTETTGLDPENDDIISVALQVTDLQGNSKTLLAACYFLPEKDPPPEVCKINGYDKHKWRTVYGARPFAEQDAQWIASAVNGRQWCGSKPDFDFGFLSKACRKFDWPLKPKSHHLIDVPSMAWPLVASGQIESVRQRELTRLLLDREQAHGAASDVEDLIAIYRSLLGLVSL